MPNDKPDENVQDAAPGSRMQRGQVYRFEYAGYRDDPSPLALVLWPGDGSVGKRGSLVHGININYLAPDLTADVARLLGEVAARLVDARDARSFYYDHVKRRLPGVVARAYRTYDPRLVRHQRVVSKGFRESLGIIDYMARRLHVASAKTPDTAAKIGAKVLGDVALERASRRAPDDPEAWARGYVAKAAEIAPRRVDASNYTGWGQLSGKR